MSVGKDNLAISLVAGLVSACLYLFSSKSGIFSVLISYTPLFPLLLIGLSYGSRAVAVAALFAIFIVGGSSGFAGLLVCFILYGFPATFFTQISLTKIGSKEGKYYPVGGVLTGLSIYAAIVSTIMVLIFFQEPISFEKILSNAGDNPPEWLKKAQNIIVKSPFVIFGIVAWVQIAMVYAIAVFANFMLAGWQRELRDSLRIEQFMPSLTVLVALLISGFVSLSDSYSTQIAGKTAFIILLFPYFLMGIAQMHARSVAWNNRNIILFIIYMLTVLVFWPIFWFIGTGLLEQAKFLSNRHLGNDGTEK